MNIKKAIAAIATLATTMGFGGGLYIVSGGDFRQCNFKYVLRTTEPNQTITITPKKVFTLSNYGNAAYAGPWSVKTQGEEFNFGKYDNLPNGGQLGQLGIEVQPLQYTFPEPGDHLVKIYDDWGNIYMLYFINDPNLISAYIDWSRQPSATAFTANIQFNIASPNLKKAYVKYPYVGTEKMRLGSAFSNMTNLDELVVLGTERFTSLDNSFKQINMTNGLEFLNATLVTNACFQYCPRLSYLSLPNVEKMYGQCANLARDTQNISLSATTIVNNNWGLKTLRIGDTVQYIGQNSFWRQVNLKTIEFVTDEENWIETWNANTLLQQFFGKATAIEGKNDEASLARLPYSQISSSVFSVSVELPAPTTLKLIRRTNP